MSENTKGKPRSVEDKIRTWDFPKLFFKKNEQEAADYAGDLFDLCIDNEGWEGQGMPFNPAVIRKQYEKGNLEATSDYEELLEYAAKKYKTSAETIKRIRKSELDWIVDE